MKNKNNQTNVLIKVILKTVRTRKLLTSLLVLAVSCSVISTLIPPLVLEKAVNRLAVQSDISIGLALMYFAFIILSGISDSAKEMLITIFGQKITHGLRSEMCMKLRRLKAAYFTAHEPGNIASRFVNDADTVEDLFTNGIISMFADVLKILSIIAVVFVKSKGLGVLLIITAPLIFKLTRSFQKKMLAAHKENRKAIAGINQFIPETIANIRTVHCLNKENYMTHKYDEKIRNSYSNSEKTNLYDSVYSPVIIMISTALICTVMILSSMNGSMQNFFGMSVGTAVAVIAYVGKVFDPIESIGMEIQNIQSAAAGMSRINELMNEEEHPQADSQITLKDLLKNKDHGIQFENVTFSYEKGQTILDDLSFTAADGESVTLAGRTGAGKSTVFRLILGLFCPEDGKVLIFGHNAHLIPDNIKRRIFGYVEQSFFMVPGSVADQISLYDQTISPDDIKKAAVTAGIHDTIEALPEGYNTDCRDAAFSQGQLQLLSIARAAAADPPVMLLDEITANLDTITEEQVMKALERASRGRTVISISHRLYKNTGSRIINI